MTRTHHYRTQSPTGLDMLARWGEGKTTKPTERRCLACGGRLQEIRDAYTGAVEHTICRGCGSQEVTG